MRAKIFIAIFFLCSYVCASASLFPDSRTATNEVELGVEGVSRLCPTGLWDHWTFRDIAYGKRTLRHSNRIKK